MAHSQVERELVPRGVCSGWLGGGITFYINLSKSSLFSAAVPFLREHSQIAQKSVVQERGGLPTEVSLYS